jgi:hypothetical protein
VTGGGRGSSDAINLSQTGIIGNQLVVQVQAGVPVAGSGIPANQTFYFSNLQYSSVTVCTGDGTTTVNVQNSTSATVNLADHGTTTVNVGTAHNTANVWEVAALTSTTVSGNAAMTVNVGRNGRVQDIQGVLELVNPPDYNTIVVDDSADTGNRTVTLDNLVFSNGNYGIIFGLAQQGLIEYKYNDTAAITVKTGTGTEVVSVAATGVLGSNVSALTTVEGHSANTTVDVGSGAALAGILGALRITNGPGSSRVNIFDGLDNANHPNVVLTATSLTGLSQGAISFGPNGLAGLTIAAGRGNNT